MTTVSNASLDAGTLIWLFGRGASMACGLAWKVPEAWASLPRDTTIECIRTTLRAEMDASTVDTAPYRRLLTTLGANTAPGWAHRFATTNWDYLLKREVDRASPKFCPPWLESTWVYHLNGSIEDRPDNPRRSVFVLESDPDGDRVSKLEFNLACANLRWSDCVVVVGMSFECRMDGSMLTALGSTGYPVEASTWIVVDPDRYTLGVVCAHIQSKLPGATVVGVQSDFAAWLDADLPELQDLGVLTSGRA